MELCIKENRIPRTAPCAFCQGQVNITVPLWLFNEGGEPVCVACGTAESPILIAALNFAYQYGVFDGKYLVDCGRIQSIDAVPCMN